MIIKPHDLSEPGDSKRETRRHEPSLPLAEAASFLETNDINKKRPQPLHSSRLSLSEEASGSGCLRLLDISVTSIQFSPCSNCSAISPSSKSPFSSITIFSLITLLALFTLSLFLMNFITLLYMNTLVFISTYITYFINLLFMDTLLFTDITYFSTLLFMDTLLFTYILLTLVLSF